MPILCKKCEINWAALWTQDDEEGDEQYEYCPHCKTSAYLAEGKQGEAFTMCHITGEIKSTTTGQVLQKLKPKKVLKTRKQRRRKIYTETLEEFEQRQQDENDKWENEYLRLCDYMPAEMAAAHSPREPIKRKFVWSDELPATKKPD